MGIVKQLQEGKLLLLLLLFSFIAIQVRLFPPDSLYTQSSRNLLKKKKNRR